MFHPRPPEPFVSPAIVNQLNDIVLYLVSTLSSSLIENIKSKPRGYRIHWFLDENLIQEKFKIKGTDWMMFGYSLGFKDQLEVIRRAVEDDIRGEDTVESLVESMKYRIYR